ncbi:MAG: precorrin-2 C(20)-methyltransferase [Leptolyngbyaceae bacterium]|nr:precorrin-2 C(20)-methyltransferase [Leptolyngbyaceae bacterium]
MPNSDILPPDKTPPLGTLHGVSVGPGDPELMTLKGIRCIQQASVVAFPAGLNGKPGIAEQIASQWCLPHQERLPLDFPYVQDEDVLMNAWAIAADQVGQRLCRPEDVVFLCEGDISFYSTFSHLADTLLRQYPHLTIQAVPGVCSPMAAAAAIHRPLTTQGEKLLILPALYRISELEAALDTAEVVVLMKVKSVYAQAWTILHDRNLLHCAYVVEWATWPHQKIYEDLGDRPHLDLSYFSILVIRQTSTSSPKKEVDAFNDSVADR